MTRRSRIFRRAGIGAAIVVSAMGLLHTRAGRPLLAKLSGGAGGCPVANASPEKLDAQRVQSLSTLRGEGRAAARPALTFTLERSTRDDVTSWASAHGITCTQELAKTALRCLDVDPTLVQDGRVTIEDLFFRFDLRGTLVALDVMHEGASADDAVALVTDVEARLARDLASPPTTSHGERTSAYLGATPFAQASLEYRFRDYAADVSATNFGDRKVVVREQYRAIPDS